MEKIGFSFNRLVRNCPRPKKNCSSDKCSYNLHIYSQKACPDLAAKALSPFVVLLLILAGIFTLYCLAGVLYNSQVRGTSGIESIPNVDFWRNFLKYVENEQEDLLSTINVE